MFGPNYVDLQITLFKNKYIYIYIYAVESKLGPRFGFFLSQNLVQGCVKTWSKYVAQQNWTKF